MAVLSCAALIMKLGIGSYTYIWWIGVPGFPRPGDPLTPERLLDVAASQRIRLVQLADNMPLDRLSVQSLADVAGRARTLGIQMETGTRGIRPTGLRQYSEISQRLGSRMLRTLIDTPEDRPSVDEAVALLREIAPEFERAGIALGIENHERFRARSLRQIVERVGSRAVGICLDTANSLGCGPLLSRDSVFVVLQYFCSNFTFFLCFSWLLPYLRQHFQMPAQQAAFYASLPLYCGALATWTGGIIVDALFRRGRWNLSRRLPAMSGFGLAAICLLLAARCESVGLFILWFSLTTFGVDFTLSPSWSASSDIGGLRTGTLSASMNMLGPLVRLRVRSPFRGFSSGQDRCQPTLRWRPR